MNLVKIKIMTGGVVFLFCGFLFLTQVIENESKLFKPIVQNNSKSTVGLKAQGLGENITIIVRKDGGADIMTEDIPITNRRSRGVFLKTGGASEQTEKSTSSRERHEKPEPYINKTLTITLNDNITKIILETEKIVKNNDFVEDLGRRFKREVGVTGNCKCNVFYRTNSGIKNLYLTKNFNTTCNISSIESQVDCQYICKEEAQKNQKMYSQKICKFKHEKNYMMDFESSACNNSIWSPVYTSEEYCCVLRTLVNCPKSINEETK